MPSTARLLLEVSEKGTDATKAKVSDLNQHVEKSQGFFKSALSSAVGFATGALVIGGVSTAVGFLEGQIGGVIDALSEMQKVNAQTNAVLASTHGISGMTTASIAELTDSLAKMSGVDDQVIQSGENMLLTFTNIHKNVFPAATKAALDMSVALGEDMTSASMQLGKALNDPVAGVTALQRVGVKLTEDQKKQVESFMKVNNVAGAQNIILKELQTEFGGSAKAAGETLPGAMGKLHVSLQNVQQQIGTALAPTLTNLINLFVAHALPAIQRFADYASATLIPALVQLTTQFATNVMPTIQQVAAFIMTQMVPALMHLAAWFGQHILPVAQQLASVFVSEVLPPLGKIAGVIFNDLVPALGKLWDKLSPVLLPALQLVGWTLQNVLGPALQLIIGLIAGLIDKIAGAIDKLGQLKDFIGSQFESPISKVTKQIDSQVSAAQQAANQAISGSHQYEKHAMGGVIGGSGLSLLAEQGPELVTRPGLYAAQPGSHVYSAEQTAKMLGGDTYNLHFNGSNVTARDILTELRWQAVLHG